LKYSPSVLIDWPKYLRDALTDYKNSDKIPNFEDAQYGFSLPELKQMERWAYWRIRLRKDAIYVETAADKCFELSMLSIPVISNPDFERYRLVEIAPTVDLSSPQFVPTRIGAGTVGNPSECGVRDVEWKENGLLFGHVINVPITKLFWRPRTADE
ncbi:hypothetical protein HK101_006904, partial [Irineochytrium annulatum]